MNTDDDTDEFTCPDCDFRFSVIWAMDYERSLLQVGEQVIRHCPYCGEELPAHLEQEESGR
jgi:uncharacterized Zn-finger protein